jgi:hypothetical protein
MNIFTLSDENDLTDKINLDDLFEKKREIAENKLQLYNKILNRIHTKIKMTSRQNQGKEQFCWYLIPEMMIGVSRYNVAECTGYILRKLRENNFMVRYINPNLIFISWQHWVPGYVRQEYKKQTGHAIDGFGNEVEENDKKQIKESSDPNNLILNNQDSSIKIDKNKNKDFNSVKNYKPSGIYNNDLLQKIQDKFEPK